MKHIIIKTSLLLIFSLAIGIPQLQAQDEESYRIEFTIDGLSDTDLVIGYLKGKQKYVTDTIRLDDSGYGVFQGDTVLPRGIYLAYFPPKVYFEFLVSDVKEFQISTDTIDVIGNMKIKGSAENQNFLEYQRYSAEYGKKRHKLMEEQKGSSEQDSLAIQKKLQELEAERIAYWDKIIANKENKLLSTILRSLKDIDVPEPPRDENGVITDSLFRYRYYKNHYFDNINFREAGLIRTPIYEPKIDTYLDKVIVFHPDSHTVGAIRVIELSKSNYDLFTHTAWHLLGKYERMGRKYMGFDGVFVEIADRYFLGGQMDIDSARLAKITDRANKMRQNIPGKESPQMVMRTWDGKVGDLHKLADQNKYTLIIFWDPDCGHCKKEVPKLHSIYKGYMNKGLGAFAVFTQVQEKDKWIEFVEKNKLTDWMNVYDPYGWTDFRTAYDIYSTPVLYVVDGERKIVLKRIGHEQLQQFLKDKLGEPDPVEDADNEKEEEKE